MAVRVLSYLDGPYPGTGAPDLAVYGVKVATIPPHEAAPTLSLVSQTMYLVKIVPVQRAVIATLASRVATAGVTPTAGYNGYAVYSDAATLGLLGSTPDDTTLWTSTGLRAKNLTTPVTLQPGVAYWLAMIARCATAPAALQATVANAAALAGMPAGKTVGSLASQTTFPATLTKASLVDLVSRPLIVGY